MARPVTCICGICAKCKRRVYMRDYYRRNAERCRETAKRSRARHLEAVRERDRARGFRHPGEQKLRAHNATRTLEPQPCEVCKATPAEAHHEDYAKPLEVRWLCKQHHGIEHRTYGVAA